MHVLSYSSHFAPLYTEAEEVTTLEGEGENVDGEGHGTLPSHPSENLRPSGDVYLSMQYQNNSGA